MKSLRSALEDEISVFDKPVKFVNRGLDCGGPSHIRATRANGSLAFDDYDLLWHQSLQAICGDFLRP